MSSLHTTSRETAISHAGVLAQALPWLQRFHGATVVVKYGGNAMVNDELRRAFAEDVVFLRMAGLRPVVSHGGGPQISAMLDKLGVESEFVGGYRVTTSQAMGVVRMVLTGQVQREIVSLINEHGPFAVGVSGEDAQLFTATKRYADVDGVSTDIGLVGDISAVRPDLVLDLLDDGLIPVVSSIGVGDDSQIYNVNADAAAGALAVALQAHKLLMLTDVEGVYANWPESTDVIRTLSLSELESLIPTLTAGMIPKMQACATAVAGGVQQSHVIDGRIPHSVLLEVFTSEGFGTMVVPDGTEGG
jgi:acetylglutamate kinase